MPCCYDGLTARLVERAGEKKKNIFLVDIENDDTEGFATCFLCRV